MVTTKRQGFKLIETYKCTQCWKFLTKCNSYYVTLKQAGPKSANIDITMAVRVYSSVANITKMNQL